jgi:hypothetical protein
MFFVAVVDGYIKCVAERGPSKQVLLQKLGKSDKRAKGVWTLESGYDNALATSSERLKLR